MSDNRAVYRRIKQGLLQLYPKQLTGNQARHLNTLTGMMTGIVQGKRCHFETMAAKAPGPSKVSSRVKRFSRYTQNEGIDQETYYMPFIEELVLGLANRGSLVVAMDGSEVGRRCLALVVSMVYKGRAIPLAWTVVKGSKGHFPERAHIELLDRIKAIIPAETEVIFLGDGEFDGIGLLAEIGSPGKTAFKVWVGYCKLDKQGQHDENKGKKNWRKECFMSFDLSGGTIERLLGLPEVEVESSYFYNGPQNLDTKKAE